MSDKNLIFWVYHCAGGLCDRLLGMITCYCISVELGRNFYIKWDHNDPSSMFTINTKYNFYTNDVRCGRFIDYNSYRLMKYFENDDVEKDWEGEKDIVMWSNLNLFEYYCKNKPEIDYRGKLTEAIKRIFTEFLFPTKAVLDMVNENILSDSVGIHIRTHDNQFSNEEKRIEHIPYIERNLITVKNEITNNTKYIFVASDCVLVKDVAKNVFGTEYTIFCNEGPTVHSGHTQDKLTDEGLVKVLADLLSLSKCKEVYLGWHTNFSRFGALLQPNRCFYTYEHPNSPGQVVRCNLPELMDYPSMGGCYRSDN